MRKNIPVRVHPDDLSMITIVAHEGVRRYNKEGHAGDNRRYEMIANGAVRQLSALTIGLLLLACSGDSGPLIPEDQVILFSAGYTNWAWGYQARGCYIDDDGHIFSYESTDRDSALGGTTDGTYSEDGLMVLFRQGKTLLGQLSRGELVEKYEQIGPSAAGELTDPESRGNDMGGTSFWAYVYDTETARYTRVLLWQNGDWARENTAREAKMLFAWLKETAETYEVELPFTEGWPVGVPPTSRGASASDQN